jgi:LPXTG-motif cell wall-anchored protein
VTTQPATPINASATPVQSAAKTPTNATPLQSVTEQATATGEITTETGLQTTTALTQANHNAKSITTKLPQTNERPATGLSLLGLSLLGLLGLGKTRRRKDD